MNHDLLKRACEHIEQAMRLLESVDEMDPPVMTRIEHAGFSLRDAHMRIKAAVDLCEEV